MIWFRLPLCALLGLAGCADDLTGNWALEAPATTTLALDQDEFQAQGTASARFTLPEGEGGAFYHLETAFARAPSSTARVERVFMRTIPLFESFEPAKEASVILPVDDPDPEPTKLIIEASLERCAGTAPCDRTVEVEIGWLAPPSEPSSLSVELRFTAELRGPGEDPPAEAGVTTALGI